VLITLGSERLYSEMNKRYPSNSGVTVLKLDKSGGCVDRDSQFMTQVQHSQVREYFFGDARAGLNPHTIAFDSKDVTVWRAADGKCGTSEAPVQANQCHADASMNNSLLPGDSEFSSTASNILERVEPSLSMDHMLLAMLNAGARDSQEQIRDASVVGFLFVTEVDEKKGKVKALAPLSGRLPRQALLWGQWPGTIANLVGN
jgi:polyribonucleotide 5'-hydroxyl-kinase